MFCQLSRTLQIRFGRGVEEVWKTFADFTGLKLVFKKFTEIGYGNSPDRPVGATYVLEALANGTINASLALSSMQLQRYKAFKYSVPVYFSQNGLVAGKLVYGLPKPLAVQVFDWYSVLVLAIFVLIIGAARKSIWNSFAEYANKRSRERSITDSVLNLFGAFLLIHFNAGFRSQAGRIHTDMKITGKELTKGLNLGTFRINTRDYVTAEHANQLDLLGRVVHQEEIDALVTYETDFTMIAKHLCADERMIRFEWFGGVNSLIGGRWKDCTLEKLEISDSSDLTPRIPAGFALSRNFSHEYHDLLNEIIMRNFYGNQLSRAKRRYDLEPWPIQKKTRQITPDPMSFHLLSYGFIFVAVGYSLAIVAFVVELLIQTTTVLDPQTVYKIAIFSPGHWD